MISRLLFVAIIILAIVIATSSSPHPVLLLTMFGLGVVFAFKSQ